MSGGLKYTLMVTHPDTYASVALLAGKPVPEWAEGLVHVDDFEDPSEAPAGAKGQPEPEVVVTEKLEDLTVEQLAALLEQRGLPKSGNKAELIARLAEADVAVLKADSQKS